MSTIIRVAAEAADVAEGTESTNFLVPDGTFFVILAIFLVVLAVIGTFVVPPIMRVLRERDDMITRTLNDNKQSAEQFAAADADYEQKVSAARQQASAARDDARAEGRSVIEEKRAAADAEVTALLDGAAAQFKTEGDALGDELRSRVESLSATLASRILGVDLGAEAAGKSGK